MKKTIYFFFSILFSIQIHGSYVHKIANGTLSTATKCGENPFFGLGFFLGFGLLEKYIVSVSPDSLLTENNKTTYDHTKLAKSRLFIAIKLITFLLCGELYYRNFRSKSNLANGMRIFGDILACGDLYLSFMLILESAKEKK